MTGAEILTNKTAARDLYERLIVTSLVQAAQEPLRLRELNDINVYHVMLDGQKVTYALAYCRACIDHILSRFNRRESMSGELRNELASLIVQTYDYFSVADMRYFEHMLMTGQLPTLINGQETTGFGAIDFPGFFAKLRVYDAKRPKGFDPPHSAYTSYDSSPSNASNLSDSDGRPRPPIWQLEPFYQTHDWDGNPMPEGWDYVAYWAVKAPLDEVEACCPNLRSKTRALFNDKWQTQRKNNNETINI